MNLNDYISAFGILKTFENPTYLAVLTAEDFDKLRNHTILDLTNLDQNVGELQVAFGRVAKECVHRRKVNILRSNFNLSQLSDNLKEIKKLQSLLQQLIHRNLQLRKDNLNEKGVLFSPLINAEFSTALTAELCVYGANPNQETIAFATPLQRAAESKNKTLPILTKFGEKITRKKAKLLRQKKGPTFFISVDKNKITVELLDFKFTIEKICDDSSKKYERHKKLEAEVLMNKNISSTEKKAQQEELNETFSAPRNKGQIKYLISMLAKNGTLVGFALAIEDSHIFKNVIGSRYVSNFHIVYGIKDPTVKTPSNIISMMVLAIFCTINEIREVLGNSIVVSPFGLSAFDGLDFSPYSDLNIVKIYKILCAQLYTCHAAEIELLFDFNKRKCSVVNDCYANPSKHKSTTMDLVADRIDNKPNTHDMVLIFDWLRDSRKFAKLEQKIKKPISAAVLVFVLAKMVREKGQEKYAHLVDFNEFIKCLTKVAKNTDFFNMNCYKKSDEKKGDSFDPILNKYPSILTLIRKYWQLDKNLIADGEQGRACRFKYSNDEKGHDDETLKVVNDIHKSFDERRLPRKLNIYLQFIFTLYANHCLRDPKSSHKKSIQDLVNRWLSSAYAIATRELPGLRNAIEKNAVKAWLAREKPSLKYLSQACLTLYYCSKQFRKSGLKIKENRVSIAHAAYEIGNFLDEKTALLSYQKKMAFDPNAYIDRQNTLTTELIWAYSENQQLELALVLLDKQVAASKNSNDIFRQILNLIQKADLLCSRGLDTFAGCKAAQDAAEQAVFLANLYYPKRFLYFNATVCLMSVYYHQYKYKLVKSTAKHVLKKHKLQPDAQCSQWHIDKANTYLQKITQHELNVITPTYPNRTRMRI